MTLRPGIKGIIFDLDGTLYAFPADKNRLFSDAAARAALQLGFPGTYDEAFAAARQSWTLYKSEIKIFERDYGIPQLGMFHAMHELGSETVIPAVPAEDSLTAAFNRIAAGHDVVILTHATLLWADRFVRHMGYDAALKPGRILALDSPEIAYQRKDEGTESFRIAAAAMGLRPEEVAVVDDTAENFITAHALGMQTILINNGRPLAALPPYIDSQIAFFTELLPQASGAAASTPAAPAP